MLLRDVHQRFDCLKPLLGYLVPLAVVLTARICCEEAKYLYCALLMVTMWILETVPAAVTATLPLVLQPVLGIANSDAVAALFLGPRFLWLIGLLFIGDVLTTTEVAKKAALRIIELFGYSVRSMVAVISLVTFEVTLFFDGALSMLVVCHLVDAIVVRLQMFRGTPMQQAAFPHVEQALGEKLGGRVHVPRHQPGTPICTLTSTDLNHMVMYQYSSVAATSSINTRDGTDEVHRSGTVASLVSKPSSEAEPCGEVVGAAVPVATKNLAKRSGEVSVISWDPPAGPSIASAQHRVSFVLPMIGRYTSTRGMSIHKATHNGQDASSHKSNQSSNGARSSHSVGEELLSSIHEKFSQMRVGLIIIVAYASIFGSIGTPYGTSVSLVMERFLTDRFHQQLGTIHWIAVCFPVSATAVISSTCLVRKYFMEDWNLDEFGLDLSTFLENIAEVKLASGRLRGWTSIIVASMAILLTGIAVNGMAAVLDIDTALPNRVALMVAAVITLSFAQQGRRKKPNVRRILTLGVLIGKIPWELLFVLGGQDCLGEAVLASGALDMAHSSLRQMSRWRPFVVQSVLTASTALLSEVVSNGEAHQALLVVVTDLAVEMNVNPLYYAFPVTMAISTASVLPGSAISIALLMHMTGYSTAKLLFVGTTAKVVTVISTLVSMNTVAGFLYDFSTKAVL